MFWICTCLGPHSGTSFHVPGICPPPGICTSCQVWVCDPPNLSACKSPTFIRQSKKLSQNSLNYYSCTLLPLEWLFHKILSACLALQRVNKFTIKKIIFLLIQKIQTIQKSTKCNKSHQKLHIITWMLDKLPDTSLFNMECTHMYTFMYRSICVYVYAYVGTCVCVQVCMCRCVCLCIHMYMCVYVWIQDMCVHVCVYMCVGVYIYMDTGYVCVCMYTHV